MRLQRLIAALALLCLCTWGSAAAAKAYKNFRVAIYIPVGVTIRLADAAEFNREFARVSSQLDFQKVYIEGYRGRTFATDAQLETVKRQFQSKGIQTEGGVTFDAGSSGGQFNTLDYENPVDRATAERASRLVARHFDELMLDDFFFYNTKSDADIAAKGNRSWTDYRIDKMHEAARDLVLRPGFEPSADADIQPLGVLAEHHEIDVGDRAILQRAEPRIEQLHRPVVDVEIELEACAEQDVARVAVVGHTRIAERADEDRVELAQHRVTVHGDGDAGL